jgi:hypothetical protein
MATALLGMEQPAPSPPLAVVLVSAQVNETVPVYPFTAVTVTVDVALAPGAIVAGVVADRVNVDPVTVTVAVLLAEP